MSGHILSKSIYYKVFATLMILTLVTIAIAYADLGRWNVIVAISIAIFKATLVVLYFMHVRYSTELIWVVVGGGFFWLVILLILTMSDYLTRSWLTYMVP
jgi:cytochrome c oxidase subunit 4